MLLKIKKWLKVLSFLLLIRLSTNNSFKDSKENYEDALDANGDGENLVKTCKGFLKNEINQNTSTGF